MINKQYLVVGFFLFFLSCKTTKDETPLLPKFTNEITKTIDADLVFPDDWLGYWVGQLNIYDENGLKQSIPMSLDNSKTDSSGVYNWAIIYGADSIAGRRNYFLNTVDVTKGHYVVDEQNGIVLDAFLIDNELISVFEVMGNQLISSYKIEDDYLQFEILMFGSSEISITGDTIINNKDIPIVKSYMPKVVQKARLSKKK